MPDVPSFAVDDGFWYSVPDHLSDQVSIGSLVRVPLSGRRVRGWVVEIGDGPERALKDVAAVSGEAPVFDEALFRSLVWLSTHYVAPLAVLLGKATPPNLPHEPRSLVHPLGDEPESHPLGAIARVVAGGGKVPLQALVGPWHDGAWLPALRYPLAADSSAMVVAASAAEVALIAGWARRHFGDLVLEVSGDENAELTKAWSDAQVGGRILVGTPRVALWRVAGLSLVVVIEEGRRAMKERQTPTVHVREAIRARSMLEGLVPVFLGPTPSVELLAAGAQVRRLGNRAWPLVEVVDRSAEPPGSGFISRRVAAALAATTEQGKRSFVFTQRRVGAASMRCVNCRAVRLCARCGSLVGRADTCSRCGAVLGPCADCGSVEFEEMGTVPQRLVTEIARSVGRESVAVHPADVLVTVGTERDLAGLAAVSLAVATDVDGMLLGSGFRTAEEALRQLARVAGAVRGGSGSRLMLQTSHPDSALVQTVRRGDPIPFLDDVLAAREAEGMPPGTEMIALELRDELPEGVAEDLASLTATEVHGPASVDHGERWLLTGDMRKARRELRALVGKWREQGAAVRVDVDPIDI